MAHHTHYLGIVQNGLFHQVLPKSTGNGTKQFTSIAPQQAVDPQSGELSFGEYEGFAIMISGNDHGGWVFDAEVIDCAGPIVTALVNELLGKADSDSNAGPTDA
jgi:hypothetical protein